MERYAAIFKNPMSACCVGAVFIEGFAIYGLTPFVGSLLHQDGSSGGASRAGVVIAMLGIGGLINAASAGFLSGRFPRHALMTVGGGLCAIMIATVGLGSPWTTNAVCFLFLGFGFYMLHSALYAEASELAPTARGTTMSLLSFHFFLGQAFGPLAFGAAASVGGYAFATLLHGCALGAAAIFMGVVLHRRMRDAAAAAAQPA
jgi:MFS family permease